MVTIVKSLVGTGADYAQAQVRSKEGGSLRLQIQTGVGTMVEFDFTVPGDVFAKVHSLLNEAKEAAKPVVKVTPPVKGPTASLLTLEERITNIEGFLSTILVAN